MSQPPDPLPGHLSEKSRRWLALSAQDRLELALALLGRPDRRKDGMGVLNRLFPDAPESMKSTAVFHLYSEAPRAAIDFLAEVELSLRDPDPYFSAGMAVDLLYHLYNFIQFGVLVPRGVPDLLEVVAEVRQAIESGEKEDALANLEELRTKLAACQGQPDVLP